MILELDKESKTTKSRVIDILGETYPLSVKTIHNLFKRKHSKGVTYQAIYLSIKELLSQGVLLSENRKYMLNPEWLMRMASVANKLVERYTASHKITTAKNLQELTFDTVAEAWQFILLKLNSNFFGKLADCYVQLPRIFFIGPFPSDQIRLMEEFTRHNNVTVLCRRKGPIEMLAANFLKKLGVEVHLGVQCAHPNVIALIGECVVTFYIIYPKAERRQINRFYYSIKDILKQDIFTTFSRLLSQGIKVKMTIHQNPEVYANLLYLTKKMLKDKSKLS